MSNTDKNPSWSNLSVHQKLITLRMLAVVSLVGILVCGLISGINGMNQLILAYNDFPSFGVIAFLVSIGGLYAPLMTITFLILTAIFLLASFVFQKIHSATK